MLASRQKLLQNAHTYLHRASISTITHAHTQSFPPQTSDQSLTRGCCWVPHSRQQELPTIHPIRIIARARILIRKHLTRITRVSTRPENPGTCRNRFQWGGCGSLKVPVIVWVSNGTSDYCSQVNYHPVNPNVPVRRHQRRRLRAVHGLMKRPRALTRTLSLRVPHPSVSHPCLPRVDPWVPHRLIQNPSTKTSFAVKTTFMDPTRSDLEAKPVM